MKPETASFLPLLSPILDDLKREGLLEEPLDSGIGPVIRPDEGTAIHAVNEALRQVRLLSDSWDDLSQAARCMEKIQIATTEAERAAFFTHTLRARRSCRIAQQIESTARELFHEIKQRKGPPTSQSSAL